MCDHALQNSTLQQIALLPGFHKHVQHENTLALYADCLMTQLHCMDTAAPARSCAALL